MCDRGAIDCKAYCEGNEFAQVLHDLKLSEAELRDSYDAVFHLVTAANGAYEFYTLSNNEARTETKEEAIEKDNQLIHAWTGHPHFRIIDNSTDFENKMRRLIKEMSAFLGEPVPYEIERKYLIAMPDLKKMQERHSCQKVEIIQTYLNSRNGDEVRVRQRGSIGNYIYTKTHKKSVNGMKRFEVETRITKDEYLELLMDADTTKRQIRKTRYCVISDHQYFEIDVYPFWDNKAIMEIELNDEKQEVVLPKDIKVIKEYI